MKDLERNGGLLTLTEEQIRAYPQFKEETDEEVANIIDSLHKLSLIIYEIVQRELSGAAKTSSWDNLLIYSPLCLLKSHIVFKSLKNWFNI